MKHIQIFTDGGAFDKGKGMFRAVSSYRICVNKELLHREEIVTEDRTCAYAEIHAIEKALENVLQYLKDVKPDNYRLELYTDSMLCFKSLTIWIYNWIKTHRNGEFYSRSGKPVMNQDSIKQAFIYLNEIRKLDSHSVLFRHINSHVAKKNAEELHKEFMRFNRYTLSLDEFLFIHHQNDLCDRAIKDKHEEYMRNYRVENN